TDRFCEVTRAAVVTDENARSGEDRDEFRCAQLADRVQNVARHGRGERVTDGPLALAPDDEALYAPPGEISHNLRKLSDRPATAKIRRSRVKHSDLFFAVEQARGGLPLLREHPQPRG